ncbi:MAG: PHP domain-containing protein [Clostridiales bacterium]|jgi:putative hydrolase|nr:PHP domain-containing protein [Clostridiales bacterium]
MIFYGDYHTHTVYSDGMCTIEQNVAAAAEKGLKEVAITDHGFRNMFCLKRREVAKQKKEIEYCREKYPEIKILYGIEADLIGADGTVDLRAEEFKDFDIVIAGFHPVAMPYNARDFYRIILSTYFSVLFKPSKETVRRNTRTAIDMISRYKIDVYPHPNHSFCTDISEVAKACADRGAYMELNDKHITDGVFEELYLSEAKLIAGSDAHRKEKVGDFGRIEALAKKHGADLNRIENYKDPIKLREKI